MTASDWSTILTYANAGLGATDYPFLIKTFSDNSKSVFDKDWGSFGSYTAAAIPNMYATTNAYYNGFIGIIRNYTVTTYLETNINDNPPSFLRSKPTSNQITVHIHDNTSPLETSYSPLPARYTLVLSLEQLDDDKF
jgi:hypothetical protein